MSALSPETAADLAAARDAVLLAWVRSSPGHPLSARSEAARRALAADWPELYGALAALERAAQVAGAELVLAQGSAPVRVSPWQGPPGARGTAVGYDCERHPAGHATLATAARCRDASAAARARYDGDPG